MSDSKPSEEHIRHLMLFYYKMGCNATQTSKKICGVYGKILKVNKCQRWFRRFSSGNFSLVDDPRSGRPNEFDTELLKSLVDSDPKLSLTEITSRLGATWSTVQRHMHAIGKSYREGVWIPHQLSNTNRDQRRSCCTSLITRHINEQFLHRIITCDEEWILYDNVKKTKQWLSTNQPAVHTPKPCLTLKKVLLCVWWDCGGIIHFELLKPGETITAQVYCSQLDRVNAKILEKRTSLINQKGVILHHDNARPHAAKVTQEKIRDLNWELLPHPPYSPDIAPSDYY
jgi:[histone H3]-lysine36 N-dimethyltransferase SETMAR